MEKQILSQAIKSKQSFNELEKFDISESLTEQAKIIYGLVREYYTNDEDTESVDLDILDKTLNKKFPKQYGLFKTILDSLEFDKEVSTKNLLALIADSKSEHIARELAGRLLSPSRSGVSELMDKYLDLERKMSEDSEEKDVFADKNVSDLFKKINNENKIRLWPKMLNEETNGGALRGHFILVFGRPEVGKSLFILNLAGGLLHDGHKVLFIENEDPEEATESRLICRLAERELESLEKMATDEVKNLIVPKGYNNFGIKSMAPGTFREIQGLIDKYDGIDVVIINQIRNLYVGNTSKVEQMEKVAQKARNLAKKNNIVVIGVTQAGDSATKKLVLDMGDIDFSNTGMPAQADLIVGIGSNENFDSHGRRMISLPKNKLSGKHVHFPCTVDTKLNKMVSI
jgi:replicative DNA helicase